MPERVLVLDDEPDFAAFAQAALAAVGHDVRVITESVKAPTAIEEFKPTVFVLDIVMPELDGIASSSARELAMVMWAPKLITVG